MLSFKSFLVENCEGELHGELGIPKQVHDLLWNLTAPGLEHNNGEKTEPDYKYGKVELHEDFFEGDLSILIEGVPKGMTPTSEDAYHPHDIIRAGIRKEIENRKQHNSENLDRQKNGEESKPYPSIRERISSGFHKAFPEGESKEEKIKKGKESRKHFQEYMSKEGGHAKKNNLQFMSQNGKTASSAEVGRNTVGVSLAPHTIGTKDPAGKLKCPGHHVDSCPNATKECKENCLGLTAGGNRQYPEASLRSKVLRQRYLMEHPEHAARLISHEIGENEKFADEHHTIHNKEGGIEGYKNKKTGKIKTEGKHSPEELKSKLESGEHHTRPIESGVRMNVTSDYKWHKFGGGKLFKAHPKTQFYDYTKNVSSTKDELPENYKLALSHTGDNHSESNSHHVINHLRRGGVSAMVYQRGKDHPHPQRVKVIGSKEGEDEWHVANGDNDDNIDHRHEAAAVHHESKAEEHKNLADKAEGEVRGAHLREAAKHTDLADQYRRRKKGVVSGLELKGVTNDKAGKFANKVDKHGTIWLHEHPHPEHQGDHINVPMHS